MIEGSGSGSGSVTLTNGSGSGSRRSINMGIRWIRIRIRRIRIRIRIRIRSTGRNVFKKWIALLKNWYNFRTISKFIEKRSMLFAVVLFGSDSPPLPWHLHITVQKYIHTTQNSTDRRQITFRQVENLQSWSWRGWTRICSLMLHQQIGAGTQISGANCHSFERDRSMRKVFNHFLGDDQRDVEY